MNIGVKNRSGFLGVLCFLVLIFIGLSSAYEVSVSEVNSTYTQVNITDAVDVYGYEVNLTYSGGVSVEQGAFLDDEDVSGTYGATTKGDTLYVYGVRLDSSQSGVSGNGNLFYVVHAGTITLKGATSAGTSGSATYLSYSTTSAGTTTSTGTSSGSSTGGGLTSQGNVGEVNIEAVPSSLNIDVISNRPESREITLINRGSSEVTLVVQSSGFEGLDAIDLLGSVRIPAGQERVIAFDIAPIERGLILGKFLLKVNNIIVGEIPVIINVRSENFLFDSSIVVPLSYKSLSPGDSLKAQINLIQVGPQEKVDIVANYIIKDFEGRIFLEETETFFVLNQKDFVKDFETLGLPPGKYVLGLEIVYPGAFAVSSTQFEIKENLLLSNPFIIVVILIVVLIVVVIFVILWTLKGRSWMRKHRKK